VLLRRLLSPFGRRRWRADLDDELRFHLEMERDRLAAQGLSPEAAHHAARRALGGLERARQGYRDQKGLPVLEMLWQDLRYSLRLLVKDRAFSIVAVATLALGIGANTAIFSVVHGVVLEPLPFPHSDRIVTVWENFSAQGGPEQEWIEVPNFFEWRAQDGLFDTLSAFGFGVVNLTGRGEAQRLTRAVVSADFFDTFGVVPVVGRGFTPDDDRPGAPPVTVLSHGFWVRALGANPAIAGESLVLNGRPTTVIGVLPQDFSVPLPPAVDVWMPVALDRATATRGNFFLRAVGRLADGVTIEQATTRLDALMARIGEEFPENRGVTISLVPLLDQIVGPVRGALFVLMGIVALVLLIACANIANLMLSRSASRARELAVRTAVGAWRGRLVRQLLTESLLLSLIGASAGVALAYWGTRALIAGAPAGAAPRLDNVGLDGTVLVFTLVVAVLAGLLFGLAPVLQARRHDVVSALKAGGRGAQESAPASRARRALVSAQVALALCLLVAAGLAVRSFTSLLRVDPGFATDNLTTAVVAVPPDAAAGAAELVTFMDEMLRRITGHANVDAAAAVSVLPFSGNDTDTAFQIEGRPDLDVPGREPIAWSRRVTPSYFRTMGLPVLDGREFSDADRAGTDEVVMVSEVTASRYWPGERAVGKRIRFGRDRPWATIVGVTAGVRHRGLAADARPELYVPFAQRPGRSMTFVVRSGAGEGVVADMLRADLRAVNRSLPLSGVVSMASLVEASAAQSRFFMTLTSAFGVLALVLAAVGIYGVMAYTVSRRTAEVGVRMALGASRGAVLAMVIASGLRLTAIGLVAGLAAAFWATRLMAGVLFEIGPRDATAFTAAAAVLAVVALIACLVPALRATRIDPVAALRVD
jgi:putative ABC transport system permease protein